MNCTGTTEIEIHEKKTSKVSCKTDDTINSKTVGTGKKGVFLRFSKVAGKIFITTVSKKNVRKKVSTTMVDFNNKVINNSLIDTSI